MKFFGQSPVTSPRSRRPRQRFIGLRSIVWTATVLGLAATPAQAQIRGAELNVGIFGLLYDQHERWPAVGGRLRLGKAESRIEVGVTGTVALDPVFGGSWSELAATVLNEPGFIGGRGYWGAGYSLIDVSLGAGSGFAHGGQAVAGLRLGADSRSYWSAEGRLLIGPSRDRQDRTREPVRYVTFVVSRVWRR
jgi:hypothetical protein